ncbi:hypothetical protein FGRMN_5188 [Fusarium graminum]|nr:hypothetical protein FGRMN_5188 [Fusarium graminum]
MATSSKSPERIAELRQSEIAVPWCDEYEKMISGMNFKSTREEEQRDYKLLALKKLHSFNDDSIPEGSTIVSLKARRMAVAKDMLGKLGEDVNIEPPFFMTWGCNIFIGKNVYINRDVTICDNALVSIGDGVLIGPGALICTATHPVDVQSRREVQGTSVALPIRLEPECWIGARATILPGVTIGRGATVAAGAVVGKDVAPEILVGGVPARFIRSLKRSDA